MFNVGTILERKVPLNDKYDLVKIVGTNPLKEPAAEEWAASGNKGILVQPLAEFGDTMPVSYESLSTEYLIRENSDGMPVTQTAATGQQESPEDYFAKQEQKEKVEAIAAEAVTQKKAEEIGATPVAPETTVTGTGTSKARRAPKPKG